MENLLQTIETHQQKSERISGIITKLEDAMNSGTAEHFIAWHNSKSTPDKHISPSWLKQYRKECGL